MNKKYKKLYSDIDAELTKRAIAIGDMRKMLDDAKEQLKLATTEFGQACLSDDAERYHIAKEKKNTLSDAVELYSNRLADKESQIVLGDRDRTEKVARNIISIQNEIISDATINAYQKIYELEHIVDDALSGITDGNELMQKATLNSGLVFGAGTSDFLISLKRDIERYKRSEDYNKHI